MTATIIATLGLVAFLTATISAILGMGGGIMLLAVMLCFLSHGEAVPTHAAVQICSNGTRVLAFIKNVDRVAYGRFLLGAVPGGVIGCVLLWLLGQPEESEPYLKMLIGAYILVTTLVLPYLRSSAPRTGGKWDFPLTGLAAGTAALTVGAVGPLIAPTFTRHNFVKERLIATKAVCQLSLHLVKIPAFILLRDLDLKKLGLLTLVMAIVVIPGTLLGKRLLQHVPERYFRVGFRAALVLAGLKVLIFDGICNLPIWS